MEPSISSASTLGILRPATQAMCMGGMGPVLLSSPLYQLNPLVADVTPYPYELPERYRSHAQEFEYMRCLSQRGTLKIA